MSKDPLTAFFDKLSTDESLRTALKGRFGDLSQEIPAQEMITFAGDQGYTFSIEEAGEELSDSALEGVAGGGIVFPKVEYTYGKLFEEYKVTYSPIKQSFYFVKSN